MKKYTAIAIAALSLMALSCTKEMPVEIKNDSKVVFTAQIQQQADETKTTLGPAGDTRVVNWSKDDVIKVFNEANTDGVSMGIKNKDSYIPATTAEFAGEISGSNPFYAVYPGAIAGTLSEGKITIALPSTQTYAEGTFTNGANPTFAYSNDPEGGSLNFVNLCGVLKLKITSSTATTATKIIVTSLKETEMLSGNFNITDLSTTPALEYVDDGSRALTMDLGTPGVNLGATATEFYFVVPAGSFASGMVVSVYNGDAIVGSVMTTKTHAVSNGKIKNISAIDIYDAVINLSKTETANCYIVPAAGIYKFYTKAKGNNGNTAVDITPASVAHLWSTQNSAVAPASATAIVKGISAVGADGYVSFEATGAKGNVIVAGYAGAGAAGDILWSWHLWATDVPSYTTMSVGNHPTLMDRDLGAMAYAYSASDTKDLGFLYQWGRKDPFVNTTTRVDSRMQQKYIEGVWAVVGQQQTVVTTTPSIDDDVKNPTTIYKYNSKLHWLSDEKTCDDPCPVGYHVPNSTDMGTSWDLTGKRTDYGVVVDNFWFPLCTFWSCAFCKIYNRPSGGEGNSFGYWITDASIGVSTLNFYFVAQGRQSLANMASMGFPLRCRKDDI